MDKEVVWGSVAVLAEVKMGWSWWGDNGCGGDSGYGGDRVALVAGDTVAV